MYLGKKRQLIIVTISLLTVVIAIIGWQMIHQAILVVILSIVVSLLISILIEIHSRSQFEQLEFRNNYKQVQSLFYLYSTLRIQHPFPPMGGWAISPDFANIIISCVRERRPKLILEAGSGVSTLISAYCLQEIGEGTVVSLDHDKCFAAVSTANVAKHRLQEIATIVYAPLKEVVIQGKNWVWYDTEYLRNLGPIDMLIIDGPPGGMQPLARYPALPILLHLLSEDAIVLLDDAFRTDERKIVELWLKEFNGFSLEEIDAEKGAVVLRRQPIISSSSSSSLTRGSAPNFGHIS